MPKVVAVYNCIIKAAAAAAAAEQLDKPPPLARPSAAKRSRKSAEGSVPPSTATEEGDMKARAGPSTQGAAKKVKPNDKAGVGEVAAVGWRLLAGLWRRGKLGRVSGGGGLRAYMGRQVFRRGWREPHPKL